MSEVALEESAELGAQVDHARGKKCERCWNWSERTGTFDVHPAVCERCAAVLKEMEVLR